MRALPSLALTVALAATSCGSGPQPIIAGDPCARCHMPVADARWGAELITRTGVVRKYDAIECLVADLREAVVAEQDIRSLWVVPWDAPGTLVRADEAVYLRAERLRSPMGQNLTAFAPGADGGGLIAAHGGSVLDWSGVLALADSASSAAGLAGAHAH